MRAIAGHNENLVLFTVYDRDAAKVFLSLLEEAGLQAVLCSSKEERLAAE